MMTTEQLLQLQNITYERERLNEQLKIALSTMELSDKIFTIKKAIQELQAICPHDPEQTICPYCGKVKEAAE